MNNSQMSREEAAARYGFDPESIGLRHRGWWIEGGRLIVEARDGASNPPDPDAFRQPNYYATAQDDFDPTYRYYEFTPIDGSPWEESEP